MRNLTIKRQKSFVACLGKMKVYIEDPMANDLVIKGVYCRKLGDLKNGEEKTFQIGDNAAKVFVIADALSKDFCNEFILIFKPYNKYIRFFIVFFLFFTSSIFQLIPISILNLDINNIQDKTEKLFICKG